MKTTLIVLAFENDQAAFEVRDHLIELQKQHLIRLADAAVAVRGADGKLHIKQLRDLAAQRAIGGAFWGLFAGTLLWMPFLGLALGGLLGALSGGRAENGITDDFVEDVARAIEPKQSALFLLVLEATRDRVVEEISPWKPRLLRTNLSRKKETELKDAFTEARRVAEHNSLQHSAQKTRFLAGQSANQTSRD